MNAHTRKALNAIDVETGHLPPEDFRRREWVARAAILQGVPGLTEAQVTAIMSGQFSFATGAV